MGAELTEKPYSAGVRGLADDELRMFNRVRGTGTRLYARAKMKPRSTAHVIGVGFAARH